MTLITPKTFLMSILIFLGALVWAYDPAGCYDGGCGDECTTYLDCSNGCECYFPENDDNQHYGRCAR
jgi:hypothetical protein